MAEKLFDSMTSSDFLDFVNDIPREQRIDTAWFLIGWFMADLTDVDRARAVNELLARTGAVVLLPDHSSRRGSLSPRTP